MSGTFGSNGHSRPCSLSHSSRFWWTWMRPSWGKLWQSMKTPDPTVLKNQDTPRSPPSHSRVHPHLGARIANKWAAVIDRPTVRPRFEGADAQARVLHEQSRNCVERLAIRIACDATQRQWQRQLNTQFSHVHALEAARCASLCATRKRKMGERLSAALDALAW
eukprot:3326301-Prymnesium_polylepis.2